MREIFFISHKKVHVMNETERTHKSEINDVTKCTLIYNWAGFLLVLWLQIVMTFRNSDMNF